MREVYWWLREKLTCAPVLWEEALARRCHAQDDEGGALRTWKAWAERSVTGMLE